MTRTPEVAHPIAAHPDSPYPVLPCRDGRVPADLRLPAGHGGVLVRTWYRQRGLDRDWKDVPLPPMIGIDGRPALFGWGGAVIVLPAGNHLVQAQLAASEAERMVTVRTGQVVELEYAAPRHRRGRGLLGPPGVTQPGLPVFTVGAPLFVLWAAAAAFVQWRDYPVQTVGYPLLVAGPAAFVGAVLGKRFLDRRARIRATGPPAPAHGAGRDAAVPHFLGAAQPPRAPRGSGAVVLTSSFARDVLRVGRIASWSPSTLTTWTPPPVLRIDGRTAPASWSTWWYPLPPGPHRIEIEQPGRALLSVDVTPGRVEYLHYRAKIRIHRDHTDTHVLSSTADGRLRADSTRAGRAKATRTRLLR